MDPKRNFYSSNADDHDDDGVERDILLTSNLNPAINNFLAVTNNFEFKVKDIIPFIVQFKASGILTSLMSVNCNNNDAKCLAEEYLVKHNINYSNFINRLISILTTSISFTESSSTAVTSHVVQLNLANLKQKEPITRHSLYLKTSNLFDELQKNNLPTQINQSWVSDITNPNDDYHSTLPTELALKIPSDAIKKITNSISALNKTIYYGARINNNEVDSFVTKEQE